MEKKNLDSCLNFVTKNKDNMMELSSKVTENADFIETVYNACSDNLVSISMMVPNESLDGLLNSLIKEVKDKGKAMEEMLNENPSLWKK
jgi:hypothetical protein